MIKQEELINKVRAYNKFLNLETLSKAYNFALKAHANQRKERAKTIYIACIAALVLILIGIVVSV